MPSPVVGDEQADIVGLAAHRTHEVRQAEAVRLRLAREVEALDLLPRLVVDIRSRFPSEFALKYWYTPRAFIPPASKSFWTRWNDLLDLEELRVPRLRQLLQVPLHAEMLP